MTRKAPGKHYRKGLSILQVTRMFPDNKTAERWYQDVRWPDGPFCPYCGSFSVQSNIKHKTMTHRCRDCPEKPMFSLKTGTVMQGSKLDYQVWAIATYLLTTNIKGISSMKLHRDLEVTQKTAWHLAHRLRKGLIQERAAFSGPTEVDETYIGGKEINKHNARKLKAGRGTVGKAIVVGAKDCATNNISAATVKNNDKETLQGFVSKRVRQDAIVYTDDHRGYTGLPYKHGTVKHSTRGIRERHGAHQRDRVILGFAEKRLSWHLSPHVGQTSAAIRLGIYRPSQRP